MPRPELSPGDKVVELPALLSTSAVVTGGVAGAWLLWLIKRSWLTSAGALVAGAVVGFLIARILARVLYRTAGGSTVVVKAGRASLSSTIRAGLAGGCATALVVAFLAILTFGARNQTAALFGSAIACGVVLGTLLASLSSMR